MPLTKRKRSESDDENSTFTPLVEHNGDDIDISSALTSKKTKITHSDSDDEDDLANFIRSSIAKRSMKEGTKIVKKSKRKHKMAKGEVGGGSFQSMGIHPSLLRSLTLQGYKLPTPIQRLSIPLLLANPPRDLVGMARTGSGKSLAFLVPLVHRLGGRHSSTFGARALILVPTRELAVQILRVGKELARGFWRGGASGGEHAGDKDDDNSKQAENLRWGLVVGGEGMDEQFEMIANNPDVIIATPGRLLHLVVEMNLDLKSIQYVVFDEADRLFEMGFQVSLSEILNRLPSSRQTNLFSATLPKSLVEFAKAGLKDPKLVRLDVESKIGDDLRMAFFTVRQAEKDACLLALLRDVIKVPLADEIKNQNETEASSMSKKQKGKTKPEADPLLPAHQTLVFAATKHHVEYLLNLLTLSGYAASHIYGTLDQAARTHQMELFRSGHTNILIVTDVAARGIDIPVLGNVVNYDFPHGARVFVHRVGRTARAGRKGWAWSFVGRKEVPDVVDLEGFLGRRLVRGDAGWDNENEGVYTESLVLGTFPRERIDEEVEYIRLLDKVHRSLAPLREVMCRAQGMYERSKGKASQESYKRAKQITSEGWSDAVHPVLKLRGAGPTGMRENQGKEEESRKKLLSAVSSFRPKETVFEVGSSSKAGSGSGSEVAKLMREQRKKALHKSVQRGLSSAQTRSVRDEDEFEGRGEVTNGNVDDAEMADEGDIVAVFGLQDQDKKKGFRDEEFYLSYTQKDAQTEKGYSLKDGASSFIKQAKSVAFDLTNDNGDPSRGKKSLSWDKKKKKFVQGDGAGGDNVKMVRTEGGTKLPATFRSGRFDEWKERRRVDVPRVGEREMEGRAGGGGRRFKHHKVVGAKPLDRLRGDYERRVRQLKKKPDQQEGGVGQSAEGQPSPRKGKMGVRRSGKTIGRVKNEIKTVEQIRKGRKVMERRKAKNARPSRARAGSASARSGGRRKVRR